MTIPFYKYQGAGNDFVMIDNRAQQYLDRSDQSIIEQLCDRRFGIGADGLILLNDHPDHDFEMVYFNSDGRESSMCGNGGRCIVAFAHFLGIIQQKCRFLAIDGPHEALIERPDWVELKMIDVPEVEKGQGFYFLNTGSPHFVRFEEKLDGINVVEEGRKVRYSDRFKREGTNVNFVEKTNQGIAVATYERGVEDETLACGTGVTACAIAYALEHPQDAVTAVDIKAKGGNLQVRFAKTNKGFEEVWLCGPAQQVYKGQIDL
jgi:diaminopimelate epimerase